MPKLLVSFLFFSFALQGASWKLSRQEGNSSGLSLQGASAGARLQVFDGTTPVRVLTADRNGKARFETGGFTSGRHTLHLVEWGTGKVSESIVVTVPVARANSFTAGRWYTTGLKPTSAILADLNGDGLPDQIVAGAGAVVALYNSGGAFRSPEKLADLADVTAMAVQDFNGDGWNDLAVAGADGELTVLLNNGRGKFTAARSLATGTKPSALETADFNGDGIPDLAISDEAGNSVTILLGKGDGSFEIETARVFSVGNSPRSLAVADFNGDGWADLATANFGSNDVTVLLGDGKGGFQSASVFATGRGPVSVKAVKFQENGAVDLAVLNRIDGTVGVLKNNGVGGFSSTAVFEGTSFAVGDVNGDSHPDLLIQTGNEVALQLGRGDGTFSSGYPVPIAAPLSTLAIADLNDDGLLDVAALDQSGSVSVFSGADQAGSGEISAVAPLNFPIRRFANGSTVSSVSLSTLPSTANISQVITLTATVTGVGATGTVTFYDGAVVLGRLPVTSGQAVFSQALPFGTHKLRAYYSGDATFAASTSAVVSQNVTAVPATGFQAPVSYNIGVQPRGVATGDFNGDGKRDFIVVGYNNKLQVLLNNGTGGFTQSFVNFTGQASGIAVADLNGDGKADLAISNFNNAAVTIYLGNGNGTFQTPANYAVNVNPYDVVVGDFNNDGIADLSVTSKTGNVVRILIGIGDGTFLPAVAYATGSGSFFSAVGDFDNDGNTDVVVTNNGAASITLLLGKGDGTFKPPVNIVTRVEPFGLVVADFNGDGKLDMAVTSAHQFGIGIFLGNGNGTFQPPVFYTSGAEPHFLATGDFNGDGKLDLLVSNFLENSFSLLPGNGDGTFQPKITYGAIKSPDVLAVADFNGDAADDLAIVDFLDGLALVRLGNTTGTSPDVALPNVLGMTLAQATTAIQAAGLTVGVVSSTPHTAPVGTVLNQVEYAEGILPYTPVPGTFLPLGSAVRLVLSSGPGTVTVATVIDHILSTATLLLQENGLVLGTVTTAPSSTVQAGNVISQTPIVGAMVSTGTAVNLVISTGSGQVTVPNVVGQTQAVATAAIQNVGLVVGTVTTAVSATVAAGNVISESPAAGVLVNASSAVNLVISSGPVQVPVPNVVGQTQSAATTAIQGAGLVVGTVTNAASGTVAAGNVISESPAAGTMVNGGSAVNLVISSGNITIMPISVSPGSGRGLSQTFVAVYSDSAGGAALNRRLLRIATTLSVATSQCYVQADATGIYLFNDAGTAVIGPVNGAGTISNSQCTLNGTGSSLTNAGNTSTLTVSLIFNSSYGGLKNLYLFANDSFGNSGGWSTLGTYFIGAPASGPFNIGFFQPTNGPVWVLDTNGNGQFDAGDSYFAFAGQPGAIAFSGDWNGDGHSKVGYYLNGFWVLDYNGNGVYDPGIDKFYGFGSSDPTYIPIVGDWNGSGTTKIGFYHAGFWALDTNGNGTFDAGDSFYGFGGNGAGEVPLLGDWNGDKRTKVGYFFYGTWVLDYDGNGTFTSADKLYNNFTFQANDVPLVGDWSGDGKTKIGIYRGGFWVLDYNGNGVYDAGVDKFYGYGGNTGEIPIVGDWSGDGKSKVGIYVNGFWVLDVNGSGSYDAGDRFSAYGGTAGNQPLIGRW